jgi:hypothetical protein
MSTPKVIRAAQTLLRQVSRVAHGLTKELVRGLLRNLLIIGRQPASKAGFVLPTTILLLLVVVLTVGAISYRTFTRSQQAITERQQQVVYNAATPVIDRARSKIEFLLDSDKDPRGGGVPNETLLLGMMLNDGRNLNGVVIPRYPPGGNADPYTYSGETRIDINGDGRTDNAWRYPVDINGDGDTTDREDGWAVYSIIFQTPADPNLLRDSRNDPNNPNVGWQRRARELLVRNAPLSNATEVNNICRRNTGGSTNVGTPLVNGEGWFPDPSQRTKIRKNFQIDAYVVPNDPNGTVATLEFQQDREATQGFKWGAWFRNDLEIFPGPRFNWNGAMHTEGSLIVGGGNSFRAFLVSSQESCIRSPDASEITTKENPRIGDYPEFKGRFITGTIRDDNYNGTPTYDLPPVETVAQAIGMSAAQDSVAPGALSPLDFSLEPVVLQTQGISTPRNPNVRATSNDDPNWQGSVFGRNGSRFSVEDQVTTPYVDDTFRADNRWGPKAVWGRDSLQIGITSKENNGSEAVAKIGDPIVGIPELTGSDPTPGADTASVGLDGYWERRARVDGLRLIVGQRLELGDPAGWGGPGGATGSNNTITRATEPLLPWGDDGSGACTEGIRCNEARQRKSLWDNLAAVQATAVYHNAEDQTAALRDFPDACLVTTIHPGTPTTLDRSATFENLAFGFSAQPDVIPGYTGTPSPAVISDFFRGRGTNGWEFSTPTAADFSNTGSPLMRALRNLANYAGDPNGGSPSFTPRQSGTTVHPYPAMSMWGDFSMLRQVFRLLDGGTSYDNLSPADKTTLHTAACTLGMLAYNLDYLEKFNVNAPNLQPLLGVPDSAVASGGSLTITNATLANPAYSAGLRGQIRVIDHIIQGLITTANVNQIPAEWRPPATFVTRTRELGLNGQMELMTWTPTQSNNPETYVRLLERWRDDATTPATQKDRLNTSISLAQLLITKEQVARDRTWGFAGQYGTVAVPGGSENAFSFAPLGNCGYAPQNILGWRNPAPGTSISLRRPDNSVVATNPPDPLHRFCSARPRYPILYSLFPAYTTDFALLPRGTTAADVDAAYATGFQPHPDIADTAQRNIVRDPETSLPRISRYIATENAGVSYAVVRPAQVALRPRTLTRLGVTLGGGTGTEWRLPNADGVPSTGRTPNSSSFNLVKVCDGKCSEPQNAESNTFQLPETGSLVRVALKDSAFYNGRELMPVRALNLDLDLMKRSASPGGTDLWLPERGIVYAYREDAVSEAHIVRPAAAGWGGCRTDATLQSATCAMRTHDTDAYSSLDPPVNSNNSITSKPVDYYPDPDRRPYGFRLLQGANLRRDGDEGRGLSFVSDNPVYVQGNFNLHQTASGTPLEEFTQPLQYDGNGVYTNFYSRTTLDQQFADRNSDQWRPSEVVADAVTLLSADFCDGSIEDGLSNLNTANLATWLRGRYGCSQTTITSFLNQTRPRDPITNQATTTRGVTWVRTNLVDSLPSAMRASGAGHNFDEGESPIFISRRGRPTQWNDVNGTAAYYAGTYANIQDGPGTGGKALMTATDNTRMNLIMVSGLVPSRRGQSYGGLHNFPRFIENWGGRNLFMSGAFLQLNFSTYATAPFDQEGWQITAPAPTPGSGGNEWISYYAPPNRRWGYDVGLQYAPAGPVAQRFQFAEDTRSEFYSEPPANDPYMRNLCRQVPAAPGRPALTCPA